MTSSATATAVANAVAAAVAALPSVAGAAATSTPALRRRRRLNVQRGPPGRPVHPTWQMGFRRVLKQCEKTNKSMNAAYCVVCNKVLCNTASKRLVAHRRICGNGDNGNADEQLNGSGGGKMDLSDDKLNNTSSNSLKEEVSKLLAPENVDTVSFYEVDSLPLVDSHSPDHKPKSTYTFLDGSGNLEEMKLSFITAPAAAARNIDTAMAKFFIVSNVPFSVADSPYFRKFCQSLNPKYKQPTAEQLAGPLLDSIYLKYRSDVKSGSSSVLLMDCWKNENTNVKNVTVLLKTEHNETLFLDNYELFSGKEVENQELTEIAKLSMLEVFEQFKSEVYSLVAGFNVNKLDASCGVWKLLCNKFVVRTLVKECVTLEFMNSICKVLKHYNVVMKNEELEGNISSDSRWTNAKWILEYCIQNLQSIQSVITTESSIKLTNEYKCLFFDEEVIHKAGVYMSFLDSLQDLISVSQMAKSTIADTTEQWLSIDAPSEDAIINDKFLEKRDAALMPHCLAANFLHPSYRGKKLSHDQLNKVDDFLLHELDVEGLNSLQTYQTDDGIFRVLNQKEGIGAHTYWNMAKRTHTNLSNLALRLLNIPAAIACDFSQIYGNMKNKSLKPEQMRKLCAVHYYLRDEGEQFEIE